ncbi:hypothetical protein GCM10009804_44190 [Kribbella hippodromi]|uniref:Uncharacterized protein n=1 Tax=Kribbella hippodromi TaxID=434347 RepID=A0ABP4PMV5_9ACTN
MEEGFQAAGYQELRDEEELGVGFVEGGQAGQVRVVDAGQTGQGLAELGWVGDGGDWDALEGSIAAGGAVADLPDGAERSGSEQPARAVAGEVCGVHAQEDAPITTTAAEVIHSPPRSADSTVGWLGWGGGVRWGRLHSNV